MTAQQAEQILARVAGKRILVIGDLMVDEYIWGHVSRVSPEAPVMVVEAESHTFVPGGAANVVHNLRVLGAEVVVAGVVGRDVVGERLLDEMRSLGADTSGVVVAEDRPTTQKTRVIAHSQSGSQQVVRVDREKRAPLPDPAAVKLIGVSRDLMTVSDALLFSDYDKGVLAEPTVQTLTEVARHRGVVVTANPKPSSAAFYRGASVIQLKKMEAEHASGVHLVRVPEDTFHEVGMRLRQRLGVDNLLITRSAQGLTVFTEDGGFTDIAPHLVEVFDGTGAGDSTISALTLALAAGTGVVDAAAIGNAAGGAVVRKIGVATARADEIAAMFATPPAAASGNQKGSAS